MLIFTLLIMLSFDLVTPKPIYVTLRPHNHASLVGEVNTKSVNHVIDEMNLISKPHIWLYLNSPGGNVEDGDKLISYLDYRQQTGTNITCIAEQAHSMAFHIMQKCQLRLVTPYAKMMQHQISLGLYGELAKVNSYLRMINKISERLNSEAAERIGITMEEFTKRVQQDWWVYGEDIVKENVADGVALLGCEIVPKTPNRLMTPQFKCPITHIPESNKVPPPRAKSNLQSCKLTLTDRCLG
jgi:ATP-dependent Clp protease, protease subunit